MVIKVLAVLTTLVVTSFYFFPIMFVAYPVVNTKQIIAVVGGIIMIFQASRGKSASIDHRLFWLSVYAAVFSLICWMSVVYNGTPDTTYATYIVSMWVWLSGAYAVCQLMRQVHGKVSFEVLAHYLIAVCVAQCAFALWIDMSPSFKALVDAYIFQSQDFLDKVKRMYGIGAMLDTAGVRFSITLVLLASLIIKRAGGIYNHTRMALYITAFFVLLVVGNMIARTTSVGVILGFMMIAYSQFGLNRSRPFTLREVIAYFLIFCVVFIPLVVYFYQTNAAIHGNLRFAFEGFFSLFEKGEWNVGSNEQLKTMIVFPESLKTWLIGDGYFINPIDIDPYFVGKATGGYYMGTDIGYCRFLFYCGLTGLLAFSFFLVQAANLCRRRYPQRKMVIGVLLLLNFVVWLKVATDIFLIFALLIMADSDEQMVKGKLSDGKRQSSSL